ncbi:hypothetical protein Acsp04_59830 [Actinomadura sp. NBRC 104425]|uniref:hypothetical protein n=1 Tax=Actinomadura sp. NBRC 104425 TaxID=3032204 RepID=UPI0024A26121|nr:hypothetical protein [Actinomadura sp. NBRC 104425]GLZ15748.1 hypothetical protein Acsp04_59830 [Actinomadura sp. NBRC 104425]
MSSETIEITVPEQVTATFVVASDRADPPLPAKGLPEPLGRRGGRAARHARPVGDRLPRRRLAL